MILPCIDLMDGKVVQLVQGRDKALEGDEPLEMLRKFAAFPEIQVIDLDAAMGKGEVIFREDKPRPWISVNGGTVAETRWKIACGQKKLRTVVAEAGTDHAAVGPLRAVTLAN